jgi:hypothetical protein
VSRRLDVRLVLRWPESQRMDGRLSRPALNRRDAGCVEDDLRDVWLLVRTDSARHGDVPGYGTRIQRGLILRISAALLGQHLIVFVSSRDELPAERRHDDALDAHAVLEWSPRHLRAPRGCSGCAARRLPCRRLAFENATGKAQAAEELPGRLVELADVRHHVHMAHVVTMPGIHRSAVGQGHFSHVCLPVRRGKPARCSEWKSHTVKD